MNGCDVDEKRLASAVKRCADTSVRVDPYADYRYILQRKDIDAVSRHDEAAPKDDRIY